MRLPVLLLQDDESYRRRRWLRFTAPLAILETRQIERIPACLEDLEKAVAEGLYAAGFLTFEAAPAFDSALVAKSAESSTLPLLWWGLFRPPEEVELPRYAAALPEVEWRPGSSEKQYREALTRIRAHIAAGDCYQVNYTFPLTGCFSGELDEDASLAWFATLARAQRGRYCAYLETDAFAICSASPELFFARDGERLWSRPMKGTAARGRYLGEDRQHAARLRASEKDRAENLMIVDMVRNDLGRIARPGSVRVDELFHCETYPTVHQLASQVSARTEASFSDILRALFPAASITGAPKISACRLIRELEVATRGVYTGALGFVAPGRRAQLNVAIRTLTIDKGTRRVHYGTGGGIVWDSQIDQELAECRTKARVLLSPPPPFYLLETLVWRPRSGYFLLRRHLDRLLASARYFGYGVSADEILERLKGLAGSLPRHRHRVRLTADADGRIDVEATPWPCHGRTSWTIALAAQPIDDQDPFLFHKTTHRAVYENARRQLPRVDEVILWNRRGELTEATRANLVLELDDRWLTPPIRSGLLAGTYRAELLQRRRLQEEILPVAALREARQVFLINSVRGWIRTDRRLEPQEHGAESAREPLLTDQIR